MTDLRTEEGASDAKPHGVPADHDLVGFGSLWGGGRVGLEQRDHGLVKQVFGTGAQIVSLFIYAIIITIIAVIVMVNLGQLAERTAQPKA